MAAAAVVVVIRTHPSGCIRVFLEARVHYTSWLKCKDGLVLEGMVHACAILGEWVACSEV